MATPRNQGAAHLLAVSPRGVSTLTLIVAVVLVGLAGLVGVVHWRSQGSSDHDREREASLAGIATAEEYYFDHNQHYASLTELVAAHLLSQVPRDPGTGQPYELYRSQAADAWCAWAALEREPGTYLRRDERTAGRLTKLPTSLMTCKD